MKAEAFYTRDTHNDGVEFEVLDQYGNKSGCFLTVVGPDSDKWRDVIVKMQRDTLLSTFTDGRSQSEMRAEYLAEAIIGSREFEGEMDAARIKNLFLMAPYIADQVDKFVAKRENFTMKPEKN
ncbi:MAG: hypothetical protein KAR40_11180 [Candidatus Sabulitectum sp.]|nr:hypothetical protein [Candidatus Sabulitectum sp.]